MYRLAGPLTIVALTHSNELGLSQCRSRDHLPARTETTASPFRLHPIHFHLSPHSQHLPGSLFRAWIAQRSWACVGPATIRRSTYSWDTPCR